MGHKNDRISELNSFWLSNALPFCKRLMKLIYPFKSYWSETKDADVTDGNMIHMNDDSRYGFFSF